MHNLKELRKNLDNFKKKFKDRNVNLMLMILKKDTLNRDLINKKENLNKKKITI